MGGAEDTAHAQMYEFIYSAKDRHFDIREYDDRKFKTEAILCASAKAPDGRVSYAW